MGKNPASLEKQPQDLLAEIEKGLRNPGHTARMRAIARLKQVNTSNIHILEALQNIALTESNETLRNRALEALAWPANRQARNAACQLTTNQRHLILSEIENWQKIGLIYPNHAIVLKRGYDFDIIPSSEPPVQAQPKAEPQAVPAPVVMPVKVEIPITPDLAPAARPAAEPAGPRPTLTQTLLSETSIKIALYLGAFFVVAAATILAALVAALRLPLLLATTVLFGVTALGIRKRLPLPSFVLFIVFSCLVPISASVIANQMSLYGQAITGYWIGVLGLLAVIWGFSTWFYQSRFFSLTAFGAWTGALILVPSYQRIDSPSLYVLAISIAVLSTFPALFVLKRWQGKRFSLPLFWAVQVVQVGVLLASLVAALVDDALPTYFFNTWGVLGWIWLLAAVSYLLSYWLYPFVLFPWMMAGVLLPISAMFGQSLYLDMKAVIGLLGGWGVLLAIGGEMLRTVKSACQKCSLPLVSGALLVLFTANLWGQTENATLWLLTATGAAVVLTGLQIRQARLWLWSAALLAIMSTYYAFLNYLALDWGDSLKVAVAALIALIPDLFLRADWKAHKSWRWPPRVLGILLATIAIYSVLFQINAYPARAAVVLGGFAVCALAYALRWKILWLGYLFTSLLAGSVVALLIFYNLSDWLGLMVGLAVAYFAAGLALRRSSGGWSQTMRFSGLGLGALLALMAPFFSTLTWRGWYTAAVVVLFVVETYLPNRRWFELPVYPIAILAVSQILEANRVQSWNYYGLAITLLILGLDQVFAHSLTTRRPWRILILLGAGLFGVFNTFYLVMAAEQTVVILSLSAVYAIFYLGFSFLEGRLLIGYASALYAGLS